MGSHGAYLDSNSSSSDWDGWRWLCASQVLNRYQLNLKQVLNLNLNQVLNLNLNQVLNLNLKQVPNLNLKQVLNRYQLNIN